MKIIILYVDPTNSTRDQRWDAMDGKVIPASCYIQADEIDYTLPPDPSVAPEPLTKEELHQRVCEAMFEAYQAVDRAVINAKGERIRSLSMGDIVVVDGDRYLCTSHGFRPVELLVGDKQWFWDSRLPPTEVEVKITRVHDRSSYEALLYGGTEAVNLSGRELHHKVVTSHAVPYR